MPIKSKAQRRFLHATHPELAKEFEVSTPKGARLPERVSRTKKAKKKAKQEQRDQKGVGV